LKHAVNGLPQSFQENAVVILQIGHKFLLLHTFWFIIH